MYKVLITGGSGFIGTNLLLFLIEKYEILNIDIRESNLTELQKYTSIVDITNYENFKCSNWFFSRLYYTFSS